MELRPACRVDIDQQFQLTVTAAPSSAAVMTPHQLGAELWSEGGAFRLVVDEWVRRQAPCLVLPDLERVYHDFPGGTVELRCEVWRKRENEVYDVDADYADHRCLGSVSVTDREVAYKLTVLRVRDALGPVGRKVGSPARRPITDIEP